MSPSEPVLAPRPPSPASGGRGLARAERNRVARELHGIVDRALRAIATNASVAQALLGIDDARAARHVAAIPPLALDALEELRRLLSALTGHRLTEAQRAQIAADVHDAVAHGVSLAGVLAGAAEARLRHDRDGAREPLRQLQAAVEETRGELGRLLARLELPAAPSACPPPSASDVEALVRRARLAGHSVDLALDQIAMAKLPSRVLASAHRIVQEGLTNARKHAAGAPVTVRVDVVGATLEVEVLNGPARRRGSARAAGCRRGIAGMRERARLLGGELEAEPTGGGGFRVHGRLPL